MAGVNKAVVVLVALFTCLHEGNALHTESIINSTSGCFGSAGPIFINMTCQTGFVISIENIIMGAKHSSTGCPLALDNINNDTSCCSPSTTDPSEDCIYTFDHTDYDNYHRLCNGKTTCDDLRAINDNIPTGQCSAGFPVATIFVYTEYKCIDDLDIVKICDTVSLNTTGNHLFLANEDFPNPTRTAATDCSCSIEANDPTSNIEVVTIHRWLELNTTHCYQSLNVTGSDGSLMQSWGCEANTQVQSRSIYSNYIIFEWSNGHNTTGGRFWYEIRASNQASTLHVNCPAIYQTTTTMSSTSTSTSTTTVTTTTSTVASSTTTTSTTTPTITTTPSTAVTSSSTDSSNIQTGQSTSNEDDGNLFLILIIVAAGAGLLFLLLIIVVCCWCCNRQRMKRDPPTDRQSLKRDNETNSDTGPKEITREAPSQPQEEPVVINMPHTYSADPSSETNAEASEVLTCDNSTNTESMKIEHADQDIQATVSMVDQECNITLVTESRETETEALAETADAGVQTKKTSMKSKRVRKDKPIGETMIIENDNYEEIVQQNSNQADGEEFGQTGVEREVVIDFSNREPAENENIATELNETEHDAFRTDNDQNEESIANDELINGENGDINVNQDINITDVRSCDTTDNNNESVTYFSNSASNDSVSSVEERVHPQRIKFKLNEKNTISKRSENNTLGLVVKGFCHPEIQEKKYVKGLGKMKRIGKKRTKGKQKPKHKTKTDLKTTGADSGVETGSLTSVEAGPSLIY